MKKCSWCLNELREGYNIALKKNDIIISHGNSSFCSKDCINRFYEAYPNQRLKDIKFDRWITPLLDFFSWLCTILIVLAFILLLLWVVSVIK